MTAPAPAPSPTPPSAGATDPVKTPPAPSSGAPDPTPPQPPAVDVQAEVQKALAAQQAEFSKRFKEATGHESPEALKEAKLKSDGKLQELADAKTAEAEKFKAAYEQQCIRAEILAAAAACNAVDAETILALLGGKAQVGADGAVKIDGKPAKDAVTALLKDKPFLAKVGNAGSGAPAAGGAGQPNPWAKDSFNLTQQGQIARNNPTLAAQLQAAAAGSFK